MVQNVVCHVLSHDSHIATYRVAREDTITSLARKTDHTYAANTKNRYGERGIWSDTSRPSIHMIVLCKMWSLGFHGSPEKGPWPSEQWTQDKHNSHCQCFHQ